MFAAPSIRDFVDPSDQIDTMQRYVLQLVSVTDEGVSSFAKDKNDPSADHSIKWIWKVQTSNEVQINGPDGQPWELWEWTGNRTGRKKDGSPSKARERLEALVGRELNDDEITRVPVDKLPGRKVQCLFHRVKTTAADGSEVERTRILKVAPFKTNGSVTPPAAPAPVTPSPAPQDEPIPF
jgi:hypothetical protein